MHENTRQVGTDRRTGLAFAARLRELLAEAPDGYCRRDLNRAIAQMNRRYGWSQEKKEAAVLEAIENGAATLADLIEETGLAANLLSPVIQNLEASGKIERRKFKVTEGAGRPSVIFTIKESALLVYA